MSPQNVQAIESSLQLLWERAKKAGELIERLREEKRELQSRATELELQVQTLVDELAGKSETLKQLQGAVTRANEIRQDQVFENGEREVLTARLKELLAKIDAYL